MKEEKLADIAYEIGILEEKAKKSELKTLRALLEMREMFTSDKSFLNACSKLNIRLSTKEIKDKLKLARILA